MNAFWKEERDRKVSYLYRGNDLLGLVRDWGWVSVFIFERAPWSAYDLKGEQTYHETETEAKEALERRVGVATQESLFDAIEKGEQ